MGDITTETLNALQALVGNDAADALATVLSRYTPTTTGRLPVGQLIITSSGNMTDGFGPTLQFAIRDNADVINPIGTIGYDRSGADNTGRLVVQINSAGALEAIMTATVSLITLVRAVNIAPGNLTLGTSGSTRGAITAYHGAAGNTPGYLVTYSPNGTPWYWFVEDDGTCRIAAAPPTSNGDGYIIGLQF
jgi:hypothetical protein